MELTTEVEERRVMNCPNRWKLKMDETQSC